MRPGAWWRLGRWVIVGVLVIVLLAVVLGIWTVRRSVPQYGGALRLPALESPVTVYRDTHDIPQVYARTADDLFTAQGYLHAQDRFWEMDFRRHVTSGRLAELFGRGQVDTDSYLRTMGWRRVAAQEWRLLRPQTRQWLKAYADGVNAWLADHDGAAASLEHGLLALQNPDYTIEPWSPIDSLAWLKAMAWDLRGNMQYEIVRATLLDHGLSRKQVDQLYPPYPVDRNPPILPEAAGGAGGGRPAVTPAALRGAAPAIDRVRRAADRIPELLGTGDGIGSNSWVVAGSRTSTGMPILANDPHLSPSMPGIWYQVGLHCTRLSAECPFDVAGFSFSGVPGVVIGHNDRIAWGFTNLSPDVTDLYLEKTDGDRYLVDGTWREMTVRTETVKVAGGKPVTIKIRHTDHGPVMSDRSPELRTVGGGRYAVALRWTALQPGRTAEAIFLLDRARGWSDFREAARFFEVPSQNLVYADVSGHIGYQAPGRIPIRGRGDGLWPAPGWDSRYDWTGYVPFEKLPSERDPEQGYFATANQAVTGPDYPYFLGDDWAYGYRSKRIADLITGHSGPIDVAATQRMQVDTYHGAAEFVVPYLRRVPGPRAAKALLNGWNFTQPTSSAPAAYYNAVWRQIMLRTFDELPEGNRPDGGERWFEVMHGLLAQPDAAWWDDRRTDRVETRDDILTASLVAADKELRDRLGGDPRQWRWGDLHTLTLQHATFGSSGIAPLEWAFNSGPHPVGGGGGLVVANAWNASRGYDVMAVPSMRMIVDLSDLDNSRWVQLTGNSGHTFSPAYDDQFELWRTGRYLPMRWDRDGIDAHASDTLLLRP